MSFWLGISALLGLGIVILLVPPAHKLCLRWRFLVRSADLHHTHQDPVPRLGGAVLVVAFLAIESFIVLALPELRSRTPALREVILGSLAMFALGFWDDC